MSVNTVFTVPKDRQGVTIRLDKGAALEGEIFLESVSDDLSVHQKVTAFLENNNAFFPVKVSASGNTEFVNKKNVRMIDVDFPEGPDTNYFSFRIMRAIFVTALFSDGEAVSGELMAEVPEEKARLSDCLNLPDKFLSVKTGGKMHYINKEALQKVVHTDKA